MSKRNIRKYAYKVIKTTLFSILDCKLSLLLLELDSMLELEDSTTTSWLPFVA